MEDLLRFFKYDHLPEHSQAVSKLFGVLAQTLADLVNAQMSPQPYQSREMTVALRKLLEAKDAAVRSQL